MVHLRRKMAWDAFTGAWGFNGYTLREERARGRRGWGGGGAAGGVRLTSHRVTHSGCGGAHWHAHWMLLWTATRRGRAGESSDTW